MEEVPRLHCCHCVAPTCRQASATWLCPCWLFQGRHLRVSTRKPKEPVKWRICIDINSKRLPIHTRDLGSEWWSDQTHCDATVKSMPKNKVANHNTEMKPAPLFVHLDHSVGWLQIVKLVAHEVILATSTGWCT